MDIPVQLHYTHFFLWPFDSTDRERFPCKKQSFYKTLIHQNLNHFTIIRKEKNTFNQCSNLNLTLRKTDGLEDPASTMQILDVQVFHVFAKKKTRLEFCHWKLHHDVLPRNLTWNLKMMVSKGNHLFQGLLFRFHVNLQGCKTNFPKQRLSVNRPSGFGCGFRW